MSKWLGAVMLPAATCREPLDCYEAAESLLQLYGADNPEPRQTTVRCGCVTERLRQELDGEEPVASLPTLLEGARELFARDVGEYMLRFNRVRSAWNLRMTKLVERRSEWSAVPSCPTCGGTGTVTRGALWDWWAPLERETDWAELFSRREARDNIFVLPLEVRLAFPGKTRHDPKKMLGPTPAARELLDVPELAFTPLTLLTADGTWHERDDLEDTRGWQQRLESLLRGSPDDRVVPASFHF